jgi:hypothetical protein
MTTNFYRYVSFDGADQCVGKPGFTVWYYQPGVTTPNPWLDAGRHPADAFAAVVASTDTAFADGVAMGRVIWTKDPLPPPPPPPPPAWQSSLAKYLKDPKVVVFFNEIPRAAHVD